MNVRTQPAWTRGAVALVSVGVGACSAGDLPASVVYAKLPSSENHVHACAAPVGDIDGDGATEIALVCSAKAWDPGEVAADVVNPCTGARVLELRTGASAAWAAGSCAAAGDANGDGRPDILLMLAERGAVGGGRAWLFSGRDASVLHTWESPDALDEFGRYAGSVGDLDGDGADDVWIGAPQTRAAPGDTQSRAPGYVRVYSGRSGAELFTLRGELAGDAFGERVVTLDDLNGDGVRELAIGASFESARPCAFVASGRDGTRLRTLAPPAADPKHDLHLIGAYDSNGDGALECMLWEREGSWLVSPADGSIVGSLAHEHWYPTLVGDWDRDGTSDFVVCENEWRGSDPFETSGLLATLRSGRDGRVLGERYFGQAGLPPILAVLGDLDADCVPELLIPYPTNVVVSGAPMFGLRP